MNTTTRHTRALWLALAMAAVLTLGVAPESWGDRHGANEIPFAVASIFFELNDTDGDLGIHALIDGEPWKELEIEDPAGRRMLNVRTAGRLTRQGLTELFFESAEPEFAELPPEVFFERFPEGQYEVEGETLDGFELESEVQITHLVPARPDNIAINGVPASDDCDELVPVINGENGVVISWDPVTLSHPELGRTNEPIEVVLYQVVVEREEPTPLVFSVELPPSVTEIDVPEGFLELGDEFKYEILTREASGNQTAFESCFELE